MTTEEAIKYLQQLYPHGGGCWLDEQRIEAIGMAVRALEKMQLPTNLDEAMWSYAKGWYKKRLGGIPSRCDGCYAHVADAFKAGAKWMAEHGETAEIGYWNHIGLSIRMDESLKRLGYEEGDEVILQIRKKGE